MEGPFFCKIYFNCGHGVQHIPAELTPQFEGSQEATPEERGIANPPKVSRFKSVSEKLAVVSHSPLPGRAPHPQVGGFLESNTGNRMHRGKGVEEGELASKI